MKQLSVKVITPERVMYSGDVVSISVPTTDGELTILPNHQPIITTIGLGELHMIDTDTQRHAFFVHDGSLHVNEQGEVSILVDESESVSDISLQLAEEAYERARQLKEKAIEQHDVDFARFEALIERELGRVKIARKYRK